jgi:hypothetical protein
MNYKILSGNRFELENSVNKYIVDGWIPLGGLTSMGQLDRPDGLKETILAQAIIKETIQPTRRKLAGMNFFKKIRI